MMNTIPSRSFFTVFCVFLLAGAVTPYSHAQEGTPAAAETPTAAENPAAAEDAENADSDEKSEEEEETKDAAFPEPPRELRRALEDARKLLELRRFAEAVHKIDAILGAKEEYFILKEKNEGGEGGLYYNLKLEAEQMLEELPAEGFDAYETEFGTVARLALEDALTQGNMELAAQAARRYFFTQAGSEAAFLTGMYFLDRSEPTAAMEPFRKLHSNPNLGKRFEPVLTLYFAAASFAAGQKEEALKMLKDAEKNASPQWRKLTLGGESPAQKLADGNLGEWLQKQFPVLESYLPSGTAQNWRLATQNLARSSDAGNVSLPVMAPCWRVPTVEDPEGTAILTLWQQKMNKENGPFPVHAPLVVGDTVLMRTAWNLMAIHLPTGKRLWAVPSPGYTEIKNKLARDANSTLGLNMALPSPEKAGLLLMTGLLHHKMWNEEIYGAMASDGKRVFCVEDTLNRLIPPEDTLLTQRFAGPMMPVKVQKKQNPNGNGNGNPNGNRNAEEKDGAENDDTQTVPNRLACYDIHSGKLLWHAGGSPSQWNLPAKGTMFLGAPLTAGNILYIIGQREGLVRLFAFHTETGAEIWTQILSLIPPENSHEFRPCTPRLSDGILICPTPNKALVAVDAASHTLLWGNVYGKYDSDEFGMMNFSTPSRDLLEDFHGKNGPEIISLGERFLYMESDRNNLLCIEVQSGKILWKKNLSGDFIAAVRNGKIITVGETGLNVIPQEKDSGIWVDVGEIAGKGFLSGKFYFIPLRNGSIIKYDLEKCEIVETVKAHEPLTLGNLTPAGRFILSQSAMSLDAFVQDSYADAYVAEVQKTDPNAPEAAEIQAMRCWNRGDLSEAARLLRSGGIYTHSLLKLVLLESLKNAAAENSSEVKNSSEAGNSSGTKEKTESEKGSSAAQDITGDAGFREVLAEMDTNFEKIQCYQALIQMLEREKRPAEALEKTLQMMEILDAHPRTDVSSNGAENSTDSDSNSGVSSETKNNTETAETEKTPAAAQAAEIPDPNASSIPPSEVQFFMSADPQKVSEKENSEGVSEVSLAYQPDFWLAAALERFEAQLPEDAPQRLALEQLAEKKYADLHARFEAFSALIAEKHKTFVTMKQAKILANSYRQFRLRFRFWKGMTPAAAEYQKILEFQNDYTALEAFVSAQESSNAAAAARLLRIYERLGAQQLVLAYARYLKREFPNEPVLDGKTVIHWQESLPAESGVRDRLTRDDTPFPAGKIIVKKQKSGTSGPMIPRAQFFRVPWNPGIQLFQSEGFSVTQGTPPTLLCEDSLGECVFNATLRGSAEETDPFGNSYAFQNVNLPAGYFQGARFFYMSGKNLLAYFPMQRVGNVETVNSVSWQWNHAGEPLTKEYVEPELKPYIKQIQEENLQVFHSDVSYLSGSCHLTPQCTIVESGVNTISGLSPESGALLWNLEGTSSGHRNYALLGTEEELYMYTNQHAVFPTASFLMSEKGIPGNNSDEDGNAFGDDDDDDDGDDDDGDDDDSGENNDGSENINLSDAAETAESSDSEEAETEKFSPVPENFIPYQVFRDIPAARMAEIVNSEQEYDKSNAAEDSEDAKDKENKEDNEKNADSESYRNLKETMEKIREISAVFFTSLDIYDPKTGVKKEVQDVLSASFMASWNGKVLLQNELFMTLYNVKTKTYEWLILYNPQILESNIPYFLSGRYVRSLRRFFMLNWKFQLEILDCNTGNILTADFPSVDETTNPKKSPTPLTVPSPYQELFMEILPDENGAFTAAVTFGEDYEEPSPEELKKKKKDADTGEEKSGGDSGKDSEDEDEDEDLEDTLKEPEDSDEEDSDENEDVLTFVNNNDIMPPDDVPHIVLNHAVYCHFDRNGKPTWEKSRFEHRSYLLINLPLRIPVLGIMHREVASRMNSNANGVSLAIKFLDRRCGRVIYDVKDTANSWLSMTGNPLTKTAEARWDNSRLTFTFTEEPYAEKEVVLSDSRAALRAEIQVREREFQSSKRYLQGRTQEVEREKKVFELKKDASDDEKKFFQKYIVQQEKELQSHQKYLEKEEKAISELKMKLESENRRLGNSAEEEEKTASPETTEENSGTAPGTASEENSDEKEK